MEFSPFNKIYKNNIKCTTKEFAYGFKNKNVEKYKGKMT